MSNRTVYTGGTFDLFHAGHVKFLKQCKQIAGPDGEVIVSLNTDEFIKNYKGKAPVVSFDDRAEVLESCVYVDAVIKNAYGANSWKTIQNVFGGVNFIVIGSDWAKKDYYRQMGFTQADLDKAGIVLIYVPYTEGISTTEIKERI